MARNEAEGFDRINNIAVVVATACAIPFFAFLVLLGAATGRTDLIVGSATPGLVALVGLWQLRRPHPRAVPQLLTGGVMAVFYMWVVDSSGHDGAVAALVTLGMTGLLLVRRGAKWYVAAFSGALLVNALLVDPAEQTADKLLAASGSVLLFVFAAGVVVWLRRELETGRARYRSLFERAPVAIWEADFSAVKPWLDARRAEGIADLGAYLAAEPDRATEAIALIEVLDVNRTAVALVEATHKRQLIGRADPARVGAAFRDVACQQLIGLWEGRPSGWHETEAATLEGRTVSLVVSWTIPQVWHELDLGSVVTSVSDVTKLKDAEHRLERLVATKDEFVASVSHELRTPLTTVVGLARELDDRYTRFSRAEQRELISLIAEQSSEMAYITEDLLVASNRDIGNVTICPVAFDLRADVARVIRDVGRDAAAIELRVDGAGALPLTWADPGRVRQILRNLLVNALRHGGPHVGVELAADARIRLAVRDDGAPIPTAELDRIFEPYHRARDSRGLAASVGLGLTVSRRLARRMNGDVTYRRVGTDNVFTLELPAAGSGAALVPTATPSAPSAPPW